MMNKMTLAALFGAATMITGCNTLDQTATTLDVNGKVLQNPTVADLDVQPGRVQRTETWKFKLVPWGEPSLAQRQKNMIHDMVDSAKADVFVQPLVKYTRKAFGPRTLTVSGYTAKFKNFRQPTEQDLEALRVVNGVPEPATIIVSDSAAALAVQSGQPVRFAGAPAAAPATRGSRLRPAKTKQKAWCFMRFGLNFMGGATDYDMRDEASVNRRVGYDVTFGVQKPIKKSDFYYSAEVSLASRGFKMEDNNGEWKFMSHGVRVSPLTFGYRYNINKDLAIDGHVGFIAGYDYASHGDNDGYFSYYYNRGAWDYMSSGDFDGYDDNAWYCGGRLGVGVWYKRINVDLTWQLTNCYKSVEYDDFLRSRNIVLSFGFRL